MVGVENGCVEIIFFYSDYFIGDFEMGVIYGGVIISIFDNVCGIVVGSVLEEVILMVILDLCIDYMKFVILG